MTNRISWTSSAPTTEFSIECDRIGQSVAGNYTTVRIWLKAVNRGSTSSYSNYSGIHKVSIDGIWSGGTYSANPFLPSGYANGAQRWHHGPWEINIPHGSNGTRGSITLRMELDYGNGTVDKVFTVPFNDFPSLASVPPAPTPLGIDTITQTSIRYQFQGNGDGGSNILEWQIGYGTDPNTVQSTKASSGTTVVTPLLPGKTYYFWSRGRNSLGWGPWSARTSGRTIAGARIKVAGVWKEAIPYVKVAGVWKLAQPYIKVAGIWKKTK